MAHAIVLGSGIAGLAAAGVLAKRFERVTVLERDAAPEEREPRKGVPQGRHAHIFLKAGEIAFEKIFPGLTAELEARGSHRIDFGNDFAWFHHGVWKTRYEGGLVIRMQSRPFLESVVRERLGRIGNVAFRYGTAAAGIEIAGGRATGVHLREQGSGQDEVLAADLIVDASGRGSQLTRWLEAQGYPSPREERLPVDLQYATRVYRMPPGAGRTWKALLVYHNPPEETRIGLIFPRRRPAAPSCC
jgi:2-polyprenyl-6-methoxyphenol hydroxylase-like FAD-dependent oxidoreductase